jgi:hypothetical protein
VVQQRQLRGGHLQLTLEQEGATARAIAWRWAGAWTLPNELDVAFHLRLNRWQGQEQLQLELKGLRASTSETVLLLRKERRYWVRRDGEALVIRNAAGDEVRGIAGAGSGSEAGELALRALKPALDGTMSASNGAVMVVATANRRHIMAQTPDRTEQGFDPARADAEHERLALSDRFGLWLGFHPIDQATYLAIVIAYAARFALTPSGEPLQRAALQWAAARGARSGRTAWQFILDLASTQGKAITF